jgi:hypothetical protein
LGEGNGEETKKKRERKERKKMTSLTLNVGVQRGLEVMLRESVKEVLERLEEAGKLTCSVEEGMRFVGEVSVKSARSAAMQKVRGTKKEEKGGRRPRMILPFCGKVEEGWCKGVRLNHGLHTQCVNEAMGDGRYCQTCQKGASTSASGKPVYGDIEDRAAAGENYRDPKGKQTDRYANVAKKLGLDIEEAKVAAEELGWVIPEEQLVEVARKRGRPPKAGGIKKKPLKIKKKKKVENKMQDQISQLVAEAAEELLGEESKSSVEDDAVAEQEAAAKAAAEAELKAKQEAAAKAAAEAELKAQQEAAAKAAAEAELKAQQEAAAKAAAEEAKQEAAIEAAVDRIVDEEEEEEEEEEGLSLDEEMKVQVDGVYYFKTTYGGIENMLFSYPEGEVVGQLNEEGVIEEVEVDSESEDDE